MRLKLESRLTAIKQEREHLRSLIELAEAKQVTVQTVKSLDELTESGDDEVTALAEGIRTRIDMEDARLEMATQNISEQIEEAVQGGEVERQLQERRERLKSRGGGEES